MKDAKETIWLVQGMRFTENLSNNSHSTAIPGREQQKQWTWNQLFVWTLKFRLRAYLLLALCPWLWTFDSTWHSLGVEHLRAADFLTYVAQGFVVWVLLCSGLHVERVDGNEDCQGWHSRQAIAITILTTLHCNWIRTSNALTESTVFSLRGKVSKWEVGLEFDRWWESVYRRVCTGRIDNDNCA